MKWPFNEAHRRWTAGAAGNPGRGRPPRRRRGRREKQNAKASHRGLGPDRGTRTATASEVASDDPDVNGSPLAKKLRAPRSFWLPAAALPRANLPAMFLTASRLALGCRPSRSPACPRRARPAKSSWFPPRPDADRDRSARPLSVGNGQFAFTAESPDCNRCEDTMHTAASRSKRCALGLTHGAKPGRLCAGRCPPRRSRPRDGRSLPDPRSHPGRPMAAPATRAIFRSGRSGSGTRTASRCGRRTWRRSTGARSLAGEIRSQFRWRESRSR